MRLPDYFADGYLKAEELALYAVLLSWKEGLFRLRDLTEILKISRKKALSALRTLQEKTDLWLKPVRGKGYLFRLDGCRQDGRGYFTTDCPVLPYKELAVYLYLRRRANVQGVCWPSYRRIAADLGLSVPEVYRAVMTLVDRNLLETFVAERYGRPVRHYKFPASSVLRYPWRPLFFENQCSEQSSSVCKDNIKDEKERTGNVVDKESVNVCNIYCGEHEIEEYEVQRSHENAASSVLSVPAVRTAQTALTKEELEKIEARARALASELDVERIDERNLVFLLANIIHQRGEFTENDRKMVEWVDRNPLIQKPGAYLYTVFEIDWRRAVLKELFVEYMMDYKEEEPEEEKEPWMEWFEDQKAKLERFGIEINEEPGTRSEAEKIIARAVREYLDFRWRQMSEEEKRKTVEKVLSEYPFLRKESRSVRMQFIKSVIEGVFLREAGLEDPPAEYTRFGYA